MDTLLEPEHRKNRWATTEACSATSAESVGAAHAFFFGPSGPLVRERATWNVRRSEKAGFAIAAPWGDESARRLPEGTWPVDCAATGRSSPRVVLAANPSTGIAP
jgi:hypothetical protein